MSAVPTPDNWAAAWPRAGYTTLPFLDPPAEVALRQALSPFQDPTQAHSPAALFEAVASALQAQLQALAPGHRLCGARLLPPTPSVLTQVPTLCDADAAPALRLWLPLAPATVQAQVLPGSHRYTNALRGPTLPGIWDGIAETVALDFQPLTLAPGTALLFDHALLHRLEVPGLALDLLPQSAPLLCYFHDASQPDAQLIERHALPEDFLRRAASPDERPADGHLDGLLRQDLSPVRLQDYRALRMGILPALFRPLQDPGLLKASPKSQPGLSKR
jgi:hypothetical protein